MTAHLALERARKSFRDPEGRDRPALAEVSLEIAAGELVCLLGPSGCGKTTLLNLLAGFERPSAGRVLAGGRPVTGPDPSRICISQGTSLFPWRSVLANVEYGLELRRVPPRERRAAAEALLERVGLGRFPGHLPHQISGGMQQRAALARALAVDPECLLMDEPFGALDALTRMKLQDELARVAAERGKTVVFVTHDVEEALVLADRVVVMAASPGRVHRIVRVPLPRPRDRAAPALVALRAEILAELEALHRASAA